MDLQTRTASANDLESFALDHLDIRLVTTIVLLFDGKALGCIMGKIAPSQVSASEVGQQGFSPLHIIAGKQI